MPIGARMPEAEATEGTRLVGLRSFCKGMYTWLIGDAVWMARPLNVHYIWTANSIN
jgi:hypothetical protein